MAITSEVPTSAMYLFLPVAALSIRFQVLQPQETLVKLSRRKRHAAKLSLARSNMNYRGPACRRHLFRAQSGNREFGLSLLIAVIGVTVRLVCSQNPWCNADLGSNSLLQQV